MSARRSYTEAKKLKAVRYAEAHGNHAAGREFDGKRPSLPASEDHTGGVTNT